MDNKPVITIKPYELKYRRDVQQLCLANANHLDKPFEDRRYILIMYCNYYIEQEPENCFVAVNEEDKAIGYIICSESYKSTGAFQQVLHTPGKVFGIQLLCKGKAGYALTLCSLKISRPSSYRY